MRPPRIFPVPIAAIILSPPPVDTGTPARRPSVSAAGARSRPPIRQLSRSGGRHVAKSRSVRIEGGEDLGRPSARPDIEERRAGRVAALHEALAGEPEVQVVVREQDPAQPRVGCRLVGPDPRQLAGGIARQDGISCEREWRPRPRRGAPSSARTRRAEVTSFQSLAGRRTVIGGVEHDEPALLAGDPDAEDLHTRKRRSGPAVPRQPWPRSTRTGAALSGLARPRSVHVALARPTARDPCRSRRGPPWCSGCRCRCRDTLQSQRSPLLDLPGHERHRRLECAADLPEIRHRGIQPGHEVAPPLEPQGDLNPNGHGRRLGCQGAEDRSVIDHSAADGTVDSIPSDRREYP